MPSGPRQRPGRSGAVSCRQRASPIPNCFAFAEDQAELAAASQEVSVEDPTA